MKQAILISTGLLLITPFIHAEKNKDKKPNVGVIRGQLSVPLPALVC